MFIYALSFLNILAEEPADLRFIGHWSNVGECEYHYTEFNSDGKMTLYQLDSDTKSYVSEGSLDWWEAKDSILIGMRLADENVVGFNIQAPSFAFQLFSGTMVFSDRSSVDFVWERCE